MGLPAVSFRYGGRNIRSIQRAAERNLKWAGMRRALKSGGLLVIQGYTPKRLEFATGGPKQLENLYTRAMLERDFGDFRYSTIVEEERELREGASHAGISVLIGLTPRKS
jgi:hypothetical protein